MQSLEQQQSSETQNRPPLKYVVILEPLGLLYGSAGRFLSPENLVGRSGTSFPPSAATFSGLVAHHLHSLEPDKEKFEKLIMPLQVAGPFWAKSHNPQNFYVPTPLNCLVKDGKIQHVMAWHPKPDEEKDDNSLKGVWKVWKEGENGDPSRWDTPPNDKFQSNTWLAIRHWKRLQNRQLPPVESSPWQFVPHLHPRLREDERRVVDPQESDRGSLFLENGVQLDPNACLVYLSNTPIDNGWYRFGGEGHLVDLRCEEIKEGSVLHELLNEPLGRSFATITPAVWGSNRRSCREPMVCKDHLLTPAWKHPPETPNAGKSAVSGLLTQRPSPFRYRLGDSNDTRKNAPKRLSRGRYAVPAGTVYVLEKPLSCWQEWPDEWFPEEGVSYKRWGCGLSLPMESAIAQGYASRHATSGAQPEES